MKTPQDQTNGYHNENDTYQAATIHDTDAEEDEAANDDIKVNIVSTEHDAQEVAQEATVIDDAEVVVNVDEDESS